MTGHRTLQQGGPSACRLKIRTTTSHVQPPEFQRGFAARDRRSLVATTSGVTRSDYTGRSKDLHRNSRRIAATPSTGISGSISPDPLERRPRSSGTSSSLRRATKSSPRRGILNELAPGNLPHDARQARVIPASVDFGLDLIELEQLAHSTLKRVFEALLWEKMNRGWVS